MILTELKNLIATTLRVWKLDHAARMGAALAFYLTTSVIPMAILSLMILGKVMGPAAAVGQVHISLSAALGNETAQFVENLVLSSAGGGGGTAAIFGIFILALMASNMFHHMRNSLDVLWGVRGRQAPLKTFLMGRWISVLLILGVQLILLALFAVGILASSVIPYVISWFPSQVGLLTHVTYDAVIFVEVFLLVCAIYWLLARAQLHWKVIIAGAAFTSFLFIIGKYLLALGLSISNIASIYGAFGSLLILLLWFFYIAQIFYLGAEFTKVYSDRVQSPGSEINS
ncbi:YihY/virulence factor BrkB family protein [Candidatus Zixiibacteriota bacterium]